MRERHHRLLEHESSVLKVEWHGLVGWSAHAVGRRLSSAEIDEEKLSALPHDACMVGTYAGPGKDDCRWSPSAPPMEVCSLPRPMPIMPPWVTPDAAHMHMHLPRAGGGGARAGGRGWRARRGPATPHLVCLIGP